MRERGRIRHYPAFPPAIPVRGAGCPRVTQPFATLYTPEGALTVRLACVRRAASVHPEPGSNSPFKRCPRVSARSICVRRGPCNLAMSAESRIRLETRIDVCLLVTLSNFACCLVVDLIDRSIRFSRFAARGVARRGARRNNTPLPRPGGRESACTYSLHNSGEPVRLCISSPFVPMRYFAR